ncbi:MAG TPA: glycosyltransferase [Pyrinomonadaceae bacterium]|nr:glycosyltransferase [Pyrinomonadaceae bacterium]
MKFSVLLCTYNRPELLAHALESLVEYSEEKPDQIVVVNGGDERADRLVESFMTARDGVEVILIKTINRNSACSRNVGLPHCRGDIIAMTDDDARVFPDWIRLMKQVHREHPEAGAVGGPVIGINTDSLVGQVADLISFPNWPAPQYVRTIPTVNISYKREVIDAVGPMDEVLFCGEDVDYNWRVQQLGYKVYFDPRIKVYHQHRPTLKAFLNQHYRYGRGYYLVRRKWREMYCVYPHRIRGIRDVLKAGNFVAGLLYQPFQSSRKVSSVKSRLSLMPVMFLAGLAWKGGMAVQASKIKMRIE